MLQNASSESAPCAEGEEEKLSIHAPLLDALVLLEQACLTSRWAYAPRFLLVRLYRLLAAPQLAHQHYSMSNLKSIQFDTLSHHVLSRASTFSLSSIGDLTLVNECVESSQIYTVSGVDVSCFPFRFSRHPQANELLGIRSTCQGLPVGTVQPDSRVCSAGRESGQLTAERLNKIGAFQDEESSRGINS